MVRTLTLYRNVALIVAVPVPLSGHHLWYPAQATNDFLWRHSGHGTHLVISPLCASQIRIVSTINLCLYSIGTMTRKAGAGWSHLETKCWYVYCDNPLFTVRWSPLHVTKLSWPQQSQTNSICICIDLGRNDGRPLRIFPPHHPDVWTDL